LQITVVNSSEDAVFEAAMEAGGDDVLPVTAEEEGTPSTSYRVNGVKAEGWLGVCGVVWCVWRGEDGGRALAPDMMARVGGGAAALLL
jgi:hypothetical protein